MRFTVEQYQKAKQNIDDALTQLEPNGNGCHVCGDSGHQAFECGSNPLLAWAMCNGIAARAQELHDKLHVSCICDKDNKPCPACTGTVGEIHNFLHILAGYETYMGESVGPAKMRPL